jgi:hypothetical protein
MAGCRKLERQELRWSAPGRGRVPTETGCPVKWHDWFSAFIRLIPSGFLDELTHGVGLGCGTGRCSLLFGYRVAAVLFILVPGAVSGLQIFGNI